MNEIGIYRSPKNDDTYALMKLCSTRPKSKGRKINDGPTLSRYIRNAPVVKDRPCFEKKLASHHFDSKSISIFSFIDSLKSVTGLPFSISAATCMFRLLLARACRRRFNKTDSLRTLSYFSHLNLWEQEIRRCMRQRFYFTMQRCARKLT